MLAIDEEQGWLSRLYKRYIKAIGKYKDMKNNFYSNNPSNDDLESRF